MFCIIEALVRRDWSRNWSEDGRRARVIYNLETLETKRTKDRFLNLGNVLHGSSNGTRTNALPYVPQNLGLFPRTTNTMLGLMQYPQRVLLHKQQKRPRTFLAVLKYVAAQQPTDRQFRHSNRPIRCSTQLSRYYGRYHEHPPGVTFNVLPPENHAISSEAK